MSESTPQLEVKLNGKTLSLPSSVFAAIALVVGICFGARIPLAVNACLSMLAIWIVAAAVYTWAGRQQLASWSLVLAIICLGICRWQVARFQYKQSTVSKLVSSTPTTVELCADISSVPVVSVRPTSEFSPRLYGNSEQTQFLVEVTSLVADGKQIPISGRCQVYVDGNAGDSVTCGDSVQLTAKIDWPGPPANPGEFDFEELLERRHVSGLLYVKHPDAIVIAKPASCLQPGWYLSHLSRAARAAIVTCVDIEVQSVALALLLGNRHQLPSEIEQAFVASGTMHLLAISGLHVGILCLFLIQIMNALLVPRRRALLLTACVCWTYAMVTDLRPSVVRAAVFFSIFVAGQMTRRNHRTSGLIAFTAILMLLWDPDLAFDTGAWLSFLSVTALAWASWVAGEQSTESSNEAPADAITFVDKAKAAAVVFRKWMILNYRRMLFILALTTPLAVSVFHVITPIGLVINILLIPLTTVTLCFGFVSLFSGMLMLQWPALAALPGHIFSWLLHGLVWIVEFGADIQAGHVYVPDLPAWFLFCYFLFLTAAIIVRPGAIRNVMVSCLLCIIVIGLWPADTGASSAQLRCTVLAVGHGNAVVLETADGRIFLVDAGAMNRGSRTADIVCHYLWSRGYRRIDGIFVSHADLDHYNAVSEILTRVPVQELLTSKDVLRSQSSSVQALLRLTKQTGTSILALQHGDRAMVGEVQISILQAESDQLDEDADDNERSLVVRVDFEDQSILLPGDLENSGAENLLPLMTAADVLISPHHGSRGSNTEIVANTIRPRHVIVSARDTEPRSHLEQTYPGSEAIHFTAEFGAITVTLERSQPIVLSHHLKP